MKTDNLKRCFSSQFQYSYCENYFYCSIPFIRTLSPKTTPLIRTLSTKGHPSYYARFQMHRDDKILVYCPPQNRPPLLYEHFFIAENSLDVNIILLLKITQYILQCQTVMNKLATIGFVNRQAPFNICLLKHNVKQPNKRKTTVFKISMS